MGNRGTHTTAPATRGKESRILIPEFPILLASKTTDAKERLDGLRVSKWTTVGPVLSGFEQPGP
jgi:hypothetical protein